MPATPRPPAASPCRLVFVYNADRGLLAALRDVVHRVARPSTYPCALCKVTYGATGMDRTWRAYTSGLGLPVDFWHRDQLREERPDLAGLELPAVLLLEDGRARVAVSAERLRSATTVEQLIQQVDAGLGRSAG